MFGIYIYVHKLQITTVYMLYIYQYISTMKLPGFPSKNSWDTEDIRPALHRMVVHCRPPGAEKLSDCRPNYKPIPPMKKTMIRVYKHHSRVYCIGYLVYPIPHDVYIHYVYKRIRVDYSVYAHLVSCYMDNIEIYCALVPCK